VIYVNVSTDLLSHWKVEATAEALGIDRAQVVGHLVGTWAFTANATDESQSEGDLSRFPASVLERQVGWTGAPGAWAQALRDHGWVDPDGRVHDWLEHAGRGIAALAAQRERMRTRRAARAPLDNGASTVIAPSDNGASTVRDTTTTTPTATATPTATTTSSGTATAKVRLPALARSADLAVAEPNDEKHAQRQALWSAFDAGMGPARTQNERGRRAKAVADLLAADITPDEVTRAIAAWPRVMRDATLTETGIASHVGRLTAAPAFGRAPNGQMSNVELVWAVTEEIRLEEEAKARGTGTVPSRNGAAARVFAAPGRG
jgi:hypothetical protein